LTLIHTTASKPPPCVRLTLKNNRVYDTSCKNDT